MTSDFTKPSFESETDRSLDFASLASTANFRHSETRYCASAKTTPDTRPLCWAEKRLHRLEGGFCAHAEVTVESPTEILCTVTLEYPEIDTQTMNMPQVFAFGMSRGRPFAGWTHLFGEDVIDMVVAHGERVKLSQSLNLALCKAGMSELKHFLFPSDVKRWLRGNSENTRFPPAVLALPKSVREVVRDSLGLAYVQAESFLKSID